MKVVFLTNYIHHHQIPLADEFYKILGDDYHYIATEKLPEWLIKGGYDPTLDRPYIIRSYGNTESMLEARKLIDESDVVIIGSAPNEWVYKRKCENKITFHYSERWLKKIDYHIFSPRGLYLTWKNHFQFRNGNLFMLCASAFTASDVHKYGCYPHKCFKWGYMTAVEDFDLEASLDVSRRGRATILWCARFLSWKHPELPVLLAKKLKDDGYEFHLDMIGSGEKFDDTVALAKSLGVEDVVSFLGNMPNDEVLQQMRKHSIFLFTSDKNEGWGAVLNESMSNGCAVVASNKIGAAPFLIEDGQNGLLFKSKNLDSLYSKVKTFLDDDGYRLTVARNAAMTMREVWSPQNAARRFVELAERIMKGQDTEYTDGPCSKAYPYKG